MKQIAVHIIGLAFFVLSITHAQTMVGEVAGATGANETKLALILNQPNDTAYIQISGPAGRWFAVGFGGTRMSGLYAIAVDGQGVITERKLAARNQGTELSSSFTRSSTHTHDGTRFVYLERPLQGATANHFTFTTQAGAMNMIYATGAGAALAYHGGGTGNRGSRALTKADAPLPRIDGSSFHGALQLQLTDLTASIPNQLEFTDDLAKDEWTQVLSLIETPTNRISSSWSKTVNTNIPSASTGFYRVKR